jgi:hypothetical protein
MKRIANQRAHQPYPMHTDAHREAHTPRERKA